jgi:NADPH2:quinone reductase
MRTLTTMQPAFPAFRIHQDQGRIVSRLETISLPTVESGELLVRVHYSCINFKDALAATGKGKILRKYPLIGGIDLAGEVVESQDGAFNVGDLVVVTGCGLSETHDGGYAHFAKVAAQCAVRVPATLSTRECMALGTAGFTAALAIDHMERNGQTPAAGEILITGATGGVGSIAIDLLASRGYRVVALTGKSSASGYLEGLGAHRIVLRDEVQLGTRPLEAARWAGAIDNIGGDVLAWLTRTTDANGNIACVGMAASIELNTTVLPLILRGVNLLGINSVFVSREERVRIWARLGSDLRPRHLDRIVTNTVNLEQLPDAFQQYIDGAVIGRTIVSILPP